jgi:hypothetical protein
MLRCGNALGTMGCPNDFDTPDPLYRRDAVRAGSDILAR